MKRTLFLHARLAGHIARAGAATARPFAIAALLLGTALLVSCGGAGHDDHAGGDDHGHGHADAGHDDDAERGEHGGRLLRQDGITVELAMAEAGEPPRFQAWLYRDGTPLPASAGSVQVDLERLGGTRDTHRLQAQPDGSLRSADVVAEPHSFDVTVRAQVDGKALQWRYASYEGRTTIDPGIAATAGLQVAAAGPGTIADEHEVQGLLTPIEGRAAQVAARYPGPVRSLDAATGDRVAAGQTLATVESNLSLTRYRITAPIAGVVLSRNASVGGIAGEGAVLFEIADLSRLWVDLHIFGGDAGHILPGAPVTVTRLSDGAIAQTTLERVLPGTATASQSTVARAVLENGDGLWRPGSAVKARITVAQAPVALMVPLAAVQSMGTREVVFVRVGEVYEARPVQLGRRDALRVEVLDGLREGDAVVVEQSYLIKADIEKAGATHEH